MEISLGNEFLDSIRTNILDMETTLNGRLSDLRKEHDRHLKAARIGQTASAIFVRRCSDLPIKEVRQFYANHVRLEDEARCAWLMGALLDRMRPEDGLEEEAVDLGATKPADQAAADDSGIDLNELLNPRR